MTVPTPLPGSNPRHDDDEISFAELVEKGRDWVQMLWEERRFLSKMVGVCATIGLTISLLTPEEFTATTKILPYGSGASGLSGLAGLAGLRIPAGTSDRTITPDLYPDMAKTIDFRIAIAETPIRFSSLPEPVTPLTYFQEIAKPSPLDLLSEYTLGLPGKLWGAIRRGPKRADEESPRAVVKRSVAADSAPIAEYDGAYRSAANNIGSRVTVSADRLITISARMPDRYAAADLVRVASERLMATVIEYEAKKASEQLRYVEEQMATAKARLDRVQREQALLSDRSRSTVSATAQLDFQRLEREYSLAFDVYRQFATELEQARIKKSQDTPVFTVLERVMVPTMSSNPSTGQVLLVSSLLGMVLGVGFIAGRRVLTT